MAARPRSRKRADWPLGLDEPKPGYFVWRNPETGKRVAIGRVSEADAKLQALEALLYIRGEASKARLVDHVRGGVGDTLGQWLDNWIDRLTKADELAPNTLKTYRTHVRAVQQEAGQHLLSRTTTAILADALEAIEEDRGARTAHAASTGHSGYPGTCCGAAAAEWLAHRCGQRGVARAALGRRRLALRDQVEQFAEADVACRVRRPGAARRHQARRRRLTVRWQRARRRQRAAGRQERRQECADRPA